MALILRTSSPQHLLRQMKLAIDAGHVSTWSYDAQGDFTHTPSQWAMKAWLRPDITSSGLRLRVIGPQGQDVSWATYGVYMGRFAEMAIAHFHDWFETCTSTAEPAIDDLLGMI